MHHSKTVYIGTFGPPEVIDRVRRLLGRPPNVKWVWLDSDLESEITVAVVVLTSDGEVEPVVRKLLTRSVPIVSASLTSGGVTMGPTVLAGVTACPYCNPAGEYVSPGDINLRPQMLDDVARSLLAELGAVLGKTGDTGPEYLDLQTQQQYNISKRLQRNTSCRVCTDVHADLSSKELSESLLRAHFNQPRGKHGSELISGAFVDRKDESLSVTVVGGGTAGYLTAISLRLRFPQYNITLVESSRIPIIGVGEATTPIIVHFLFDILKLDIVEFYREVRPTIKEGIRFNWGLPGEYAFNHPFGLGDVYASHLDTGHIDNCSLTSMMMVAEKAPMLETGREESPYMALLHRTPHAYHLDNKLFVEYLTRKAREIGVNYVDAVINAEATVQDDNGDVQSLQTEDGRVIESDFFIDCTGFRSLLMGGVLESPFEDYSSSLFTDRAVVGNAPHDGHIRPFTAADTMNHGWCWGTPLRDSDHHGYVFSSAHCSDDEALAEMKSKYDLTTEPRVVKFRTGRRRDFWKGNVFAIGNSYGFVEPLESTGIHMIIQSIMILIAHFPQEKSNVSVRPLINERMRAHWDFIRWFLAVHYKYNKKLDTPFWQACREDVDISGVQDLVNLFEEFGPLSYQPNHMREIMLPFEKDIVFGPFGFDVMFLGQGVVPKRNIPIQDGGAYWRTRYQISKQLLQMAMPQKKALEVLDAYPELLRV